MNGMGSTARLNLAGVVLLCSVFGSPSQTNPYADIVQRNVFGLREPPALRLPDPVVGPTNDLPELMLTGIADFRKAQWALLTSAERGKQPRRYTLKVGEREGDLQVLAIDAEAGTVHVLHGAAEVVLTFDTHGLPTATKLEEESRKYVQRSQPFVDEHTRAHALREKREQERRDLERVAAEAELAARQLSNQQ